MNQKTCPSESLAAEAANLRHRYESNSEMAQFIDMLVTNQTNKACSLLKYFLPVMTARILHEFWLIGRVIISYPPWCRTNINLYNPDEVAVTVIPNQKHPKLTWFEQDLTPTCLYLVKRAHPYDHFGLSALRDFGLSALRDPKFGNDHYFSAAFDCFSAAFDFTLRVGKEHLT